MKRFLSLILVALALAAAPVATFTACTSTQQTVAYKTLYSLEKSVNDSYNGYCAEVIKGTIPTNSVPQVSQKFNQFQAGMTLAIGLAQNNTNAIAPASLAAEGADLISFIATFTNKK